VLASSNGSVLFSGEALYRGRDMGTVEAALASGRDTARTILAADRLAAPCVRPHAAEMTTRVSENLFGVGRAIWTGVPDRIQHIIQSCHCIFR
jgi:hypothetical protein